jgi:hypothetical protein
MTSGTFGAPVRSRLQAALGATPPPPPGLRPFSTGDVPALAAAMWAAYRGTPDEAAPEAVTGVGRSREEEGQERLVPVEGDEGRAYRTVLVVGDE